MFMESSKVLRKEDIAGFYPFLAQLLRQTDEMENEKDRVETLTECLYAISYSLIEYVDLTDLLF